MNPRPPGDPAETSTISSGRNVESPALYIELGGVLDGACNMTGKEPKVIPLVKSEEKQNIPTIKTQNP